MALFTKAANDVFAGYDANGNARSISPQDSQVWGTEVERYLDALGVSQNLVGEWDASSGTFPGSGAAALGDTWLVTTAGTTGGRFFGEGDKLVAVKNNPSTTVYATNWGMISAPGKGYEPGMDAGAGTANAIIVTTDKAVGDGQVVMFSLYRDTTGAPVTISINGGPALTVKVNRNDVNASALTEGQDIWGRIRSSDNTFRLLNDQDVSALVAQAEAALAEFRQGYLGAKASDPATDNEGNPIIEGALYWNSVDGKFRVYHSGAWEDFSSIPDGSVSNVKLADVPSGTIKGRASAGTGDPENLTTAQVRELLEVRKYTELWDQTPYPFSVVDEAEYSHFPVIAQSQNVIGVTYKQGPQHDYSLHTAVCQSQKPDAGGSQDLILNGDYASGGAVTLPIPTVIDILSDANDTARTFTVFGLVDGLPDNETISGPPANFVVGSRGTKVFSTVTRVAVDGNTAGNIRVGAFVVPQDVAYKYTTNAGASWSGKINIFDGLAGNKCYYYGVIGTRSDGSIIALAADVQNPGESWPLFRKISPDGKDWTAEAAPITVTGDVPAKCKFYGKIQRTPSGRLVVNGYHDDDRTYVLWSDDGGLNWTSKALIENDMVRYTEVAIGIADELNWFAVVRVDGASTRMIQLKTADGGLTWTNQGSTNLPLSTGYKSPDLVTVFVDGEPFFACVFMARSTSTPALYVNSMCMIVGRAVDILNSPANWSRQFVVADNLMITSGYPSVWVNPHSNVALMAYGKETELFHASQVETKSVNIVQIIADWKIQPYFATLMEINTAISTPPMPVGAVGFGFLGLGSTARTAMFTWDTVGTYQIAFLVEGSDASILDVTTGPLTGATGTPGHITLSIDTSGKIYIENRLAPAALTLMLPRR
ncbi:glycoside hydrolase [Pseudomonas sp. R2.Fl]|nr:glycoside hydrolase [Pseudomonas sp. R2.Fl]